MSASHGHDVRSKSRVIQNLPDAVSPEKQLNSCPTRRRYLMNIRALAESLFNIGGFKALYRGDRIILRVTRKSPRTDRCAEQMNGSA